MNLFDIFKNKVVIYLASRYVIYGVQFITSLVIAAELGPYYMGIWGFILLILQYFQQLHFGIANSFNILYIHHRENNAECNNYIGNSLILVSYLSLLVVVFYLYYIIFGIESIEKYQIGRYVVWICLIAILQYFVQFFINLFRVKNQLNKVTFCQSIIVLLNFLCIFFYRGESLIQWLVFGYVLGNILCVVLAIISNCLPKLNKVQFSNKYQKEIFKKGIYLFVYNSCLSFIIIIVRTIISDNYTLEEFGIFTFSFSLANAFLLLLDALSFVIFPKFLGKLSSSNETTTVQSSISFYREIYITSAHLLIYLSIIIFPFILLFFPKYEGALVCLNLIALTILMYTNASGYIELLISRNKEKLASILSISALSLNSVLAIIMAYILHYDYEYIILSTMITYVLYTIAVMCFACKELKIPFSYLELFPRRLFIPYISALLITIFYNKYCIFIPMLLFAMLNINSIKEIIKTAHSILKSPDRVNL